METAERANRQGSADLVVRNARIAGRDDSVDIVVEAGVIRAIEAKAPSGAREIDAGSRLVTPSFVDPHLHLDKALTADRARPNTLRTFEGALAVMREVKASYTLDDVAARAGKVIELALAHGQTYIRTNVDVDSIAGLTALHGVLEARRRYRDLVDIQIVAFPQEGILQDDGTADRLRAAMKLGADVVGGMPANEMTDADSERHIDVVFELAKEFDADIDMHIDETDDPGSRTLYYLAVKTIRERYEGRVTAGHACALAAYDDYYAAKVIGLVKRANLNIVSNPFKLMRGGIRDRGRIRRGLTRVRELLEAGVNVSFGQDVVCDGFSPIFGRCDSLELGFLMAHAAQFNTPEEVATVLDMCTVNPARALRLKRYGLAEGQYADFNVLNAPSVSEALRWQAERLFVIRRGRVLAETTRTTRLHLT